MRIIGHLANESAARTFSDYLYVQGIENQLEFHKGTGWAVWVNDEDKLDGATSLLQQFQKEPADPKYQTQAKNAAEIRADREKTDEAYRKRIRDARQMFRPLTAYGFGMVTFVFLVLSVVVFLLSKLGQDLRVMLPLSITNYSLEGLRIYWDPTLPEIRHGQLWRLVTPIFLHLNPLHILFNMLWLRDLGSMIEARQTSWLMVVLVLVLAVVSNLAQFYIGHTPNFGGMSGVVYGLLGYIWMRGKFDPGSGLFLHPTTVLMMIAWFVLCFTGLVGHVANAAHAAGLFLGMAWGYLASLRYR